MSDKAGHARGRAGMRVRGRSRAGPPEKPDGWRKARVWAGINPVAKIIGNTHPDEKVGARFISPSGILMDWGGRAASSPHADACV